MTYQQRVEILKELPRGTKVTVMPRVRLGDMGTDGTKLEDRSRGMIVQFKGNKTYIGYRRLTCEKIKMVEAVIARLSGEPRGMTMAELHASVKPFYTQQDYDDMVSKIRRVPPLEL